MAASGCVYTLDRNQDAPPGSISGRAVDADGNPIPFAKVGIMGSGITLRANDVGIFRTDGLREGSWTLRITQDIEADGFIDRGAVLQTTITAQLHPGDVEPRLVSVALGDVVLLGVGQVQGTVQLDGQPQPGSRVVVERMVGEGATATAVGVEASVTAEDGTFVVENLLPGIVRLAAMTTIEGADFVSPSRLVTVDAATDTRLSLQPAEGTRFVRINTAPAPAAADAVAVTLTGLEVTETFAGLSLDAPVGGAWNVAIDNETAELRGVLLGQVVPPGDDTLVWGPVGLSSDDEQCARIGELRDCDRDSFPGLPQLQRNLDGSLPPDELVIWQACGTQCAVVGTESCEAAGTTYDCDDDGDGQADVTEPPECYGVNLGTDLDGDGFCDPLDPHPGCDDRPVELDCSTAGLLPPLWFEYEEGGVDVDGGPDDAGSPDAGAGDAGTPDGGAFDGGVPDAGPLDGGPDAGPGPDGGLPVDAGADAGPADAGPADAGPADAGPADAGPPPTPPPPETGFRALPTPPPQTGARQLLEHQLLPAAKSCDATSGRCVSGGLVP